MVFEIYNWSLWWPHSAHITSAIIFVWSQQKNTLSVQLLSRVQFFAPPWSAALQASLSITSSQNLPKLMPIESVMPSNHLILCRPLFPLLSIFPSTRVFSNESVLCIYICIYVCVCVCVCVEDIWCKVLRICVCMCICIYIYIYM